MTETEQPKLVFLDLETTGLDPNRHDVWEIGAIVRYPTGDELTIHSFVKPPALKTAEPAALKINRYYERTLGFTLSGEYYSDGTGVWSNPVLVAQTLSRVLDQAHIVGAVPDFDARFLKEFFDGYNVPCTWHYHLIDVESLVAGYVQGILTSSDDPMAYVTENYSTADQISKPLWKSRDLYSLIGLTLKEGTEHTALGDAQFVKQIYDKVYEYENE